MTFNIILYFSLGPEEAEMPIVNKIATAMVSSSQPKLPNGWAG